MLFHQTLLSLILASPQDTAKKLLPYKALAYYASAADDSISMSRLLPGYLCHCSNTKSARGKRTCI